MKKILYFIIILPLFLTFSSPAFSSTELRNPQGRMGLSYKPEIYNPIYKTNLSKADLEKIGAIIKQEKDAAKQAAKEEKKEYYEKLKHQKEAKELARKNALAKIKADEQAQKNAIKEQKKIELQAQKEKLAQEKRYQKELKEKEKLALLQKKEKLEQEKQQLKLQEKQKKAEEKELKKIAKQEASETENKSEKKLNFLTKISSHKPEESVPSEQVRPEETPITQSKQEAIKKITTSSAKIQQDAETKRIITEVTEELNSERPKMLEELSALWVSAVQKSDTVYFAIMKLSNPNGEEVNKNGFKKIMEPIIGAAPLVGQAFVNPAMTAGSLIGSNVLGTMMNDNASKRLSKVNDADLVILARAIDELQETLLVNYMAYKSAQKEYEFAIKITEARKKTYDELNKINSPHVILANTFYAEALDNQYKARQDFLMKRVVLEQMVGTSALNELENQTSKTTANAQ